MGNSEMALSATERMRRWRHAHPESNAKWRKKYKLDHPEARVRWFMRHKEEIYARINTWRNKHPEAGRKYLRNWRKENPAKATLHSAMRRASILKATPPWVDIDEILPFYEEAKRMTFGTGILHTVDHIVPLKNHVVCGLHVPWNLQVMTSSENAKKKNNFTAGFISV